MENYKKKWTKNKKHWAKAVKYWEKEIIAAARRGEPGDVAGIVPELINCATLYGMASIRAE